MNIHPAGYCAGLRAPIRRSACSTAQDLTLSGEGRGVVLETSTARWCKEQQHSGMTDEQRQLYSISSSILFFFAKAQSHSIIHHLIKLLRFLHYSPLSQARGGLRRGKVYQFSFTRARSHVQRGSARVTAPWHFEGSQWESTHSQEMSSLGHVLAAFALTPSWRATPYVLLSLRAADVAACSLTRMHAQNAPESRRKCTFSFIHQSAPALPRDRKLYAVSIKSNVFLILYWAPLGTYQYVLSGSPTRSIARELCTS